MNTFPYVYYIPLSQQHAVESWCRQQWPYTYGATWAMHNYGTRLADRDSITAWQQPTVCIFSMSKTVYCLCSSGMISCSRCWMT